MVDDISATIEERGWRMCLDNRMRNSLEELQHSSRSLHTSEMVVIAEFVCLCECSRKHIM